MPQMIRDHRYEENVRREGAEEQLYHEQQETTQTEPESSFETLERFCEEDRARAAEASAQDSADDELVAKAIQTINGMYRQGVDNGKLEIGTYVLEEVFKGKVEEAMSTTPHKHTTFGKIAADPTLLVEPKTLGSWVRAAAVVRDLSLREFYPAHLTTYHYVELASVKNENERVRLAQEADSKKWTVKELRSHIRKARGTTKSDIEKLKEELKKGLKAFTDLPAVGDLKEFTSDGNAVREAYPFKTATKILPEVNESLSRIKAAAEMLKAFQKNLSEIVKETCELPSD